MKKVIAVFAALLIAAPVAVLAGPETGDRSLTLSGVGSSDNHFDGNTFGGGAEVGIYHSEQVLYGVRQVLQVAAGDDVRDRWLGVTRGFVNYNFGTGDARPYVGANLGGVYGRRTKETGTAGLEAGVRYFVKDKTFIQFGVDYQFLFDDSDDVDNGFEDGVFLYNLGIGFNF